MRLDRVFSVDDMARLAQKKLPRFAYDFIAGAAGNEINLRRNSAALQEVCITPRYLRDVSKRSASVTLFKQRYASPIGIAPIGLANIAGHGADLAMAKSAAKHNAPYILSSVATTSIEDIAKVANGNLWFQLYLSDDDEIGFDLVRRAKEAGVQNLVLTVDVPGSGRRLRDLRNGFVLPLKPTARLAWDLLTHPAWATSMAINGSPKFENLIPYQQEQSAAQSLAEFMLTQISSKLQPDRIRRLRDLWSGEFIIKGILHSEDAKLAVDEIGATGLIISNHGGRQCDVAPSAIEAIPKIVSTVGDRACVMMDSGIRSGTDILRAYASGVNYVFAGRPFLFGAAARMDAGVEQIFKIFSQEIDQGLAQIGCPDINDLGPDYLWKKDTP